MLNKLNKLTKNTIIIISFFLIFIDVSVGQENLFKSRLLFKKIPEANNLDTKTKNDEKGIEALDIMKNTEKDLEYINIKKEKDENKKNKKKEQKDNKIIKIIYISGQIKPSEKDINYLIKNISTVDKNKKINIHAYASKGSNQTSSDARRLSLSRALSVRKLLINNKFLSTNIYVRAMGAEVIKNDNQDIVIIDIN